MSQYTGFTPGMTITPVDLTPMTRGPTVEEICSRALQVTSEALSVTSLPKVDLPTFIDSNYVEKVIASAMMVVEEVNDSFPTTAEGAQIFSPARQPPPGLSPNPDHPSFKPFMATGYYNGAGDSSIEEKNLWFDDLYSYEIIPTSRPFYSLKSSPSLIEL